MKKGLLFLTVAVLALLLAAGCSRSGSGSPGGGVGSNKAAGNEKIRVYFIPKNLGNPYFEALSAGFYDAIAQLGEDNFIYTYTGPETALADNQIPFVEEAMRKGADAVFIAVNSADALGDIFDEARKAGVRIYCINQDISGNEASRDAAILPVNFDTVGAALLETLGKQIGYQGPIAILSATADAPDQNIWIDFIKQELKNNPKYGGIQLAAIAYGDDQTEKSAAETEILLDKVPPLKGLIVPTAVGLPAACAVIKERGLSGNIKITGLGLPSEMADFVQDGTCEGFHLWNPPYEGYIGIYLVWAEKKGVFVPAPGAKFSAGKLGEYTIMPNGQIITLEQPMLYDISNIREYAVLF
jgi:rhamnose transport system substrate-binding protein